MSEFAFKLADMNYCEIAVGPDPIEVRAMVNGKKVRVGEGRINPETMIFTTTLDDYEENPNAKILMDIISARGDEDYRVSGFVSVSEVTLLDESEHERVRNALDNARKET